jgi:hypothetical protein
MFIDETGGLIDDERPLRRALKRKRPSLYGDLSLPYVIAVSEQPFSIGDESWHRTNVLFGQEAVEYGPGRPVRTVYVPDGIWRGPRPRPRNRRMSAVLLASHLTPWTIGVTKLEWWDNPFADQPVPDDLIPEVAERYQLVVDDMGVGHVSNTEARRAPGLVFHC